ncbi:MAG: hypothetical protein NVSMB69_10950 [Novosphingobium sp.]
MSEPATSDPVWASGPLAQVRWIVGRPLAWQVRLDDEQAIRDAGRALLTAREVAAFARIGDAPWRIMRRRLAKALLAWVARCHPDDVRFERDAFGALRVQAPDGWHVSLAGQPPFALIAVHRAPIGADIEPSTAAAPPADAFAAAEIAVLDSLYPGDRDRAGLIGWVAKEAHAKASGQARQLDPRDIMLDQRGDSLVASSGAFTSAIHVKLDGATIAALAM